MTRFLLAVVKNRAKLAQDLSKSLDCVQQQIESKTMRITSALIAASAMVSFALAQDAPAPTTEPATPAAQPAATPESDAAAEKLFDKFIAISDEMSKLTASITDKATADAAAPELMKLMEKLQALQAENPNMPDPSPALLEKLMPKLMEMGAKSYQDMLRITQAECYGSEALKAAMQSMIPKAPREAKEAPAEK